MHEVGHNCPVLALLTFSCDLFHFPHRVSLSNLDRSFSPSSRVGLIHEDNNNQNQAQPLTEILNLDRRNAFSCFTSS